MAVIMTSGLISLASLVLLIMMARSAPLGHQDETGFHFGSPLPQPLDFRALVFDEHETAALPVIPVPTKVQIQKAA